MYRTSGHAWFKKPGKKKACDAPSNKRNLLRLVHVIFENGGIGTSNVWSVGYQLWELWNAMCETFP